MTGEVSWHRCFADEMHKVELARVSCFTERAQAAPAAAAEPTEGLTLLSEQH